jgi:hypothetical protein
MPKRVAPPKLTGGGGFVFEDDVAAYFLACLLAGHPPLDPTLGFLTRVDFQTRSDVKPLDRHKLELTFQDGLNAVVDLDRVITRFDGIFAALNDREYFRSVSLDPEAATIVWPNGADICLDVLYSYASGKPIIVNGERVFN